MKGWISLHRKIQDHWLFKEKRQFSKFEAWIDLIMSANHKDNKTLLGNELVEIKRGSFITSELKLMDKWSWSKTKVRAFLTLLEEENMIEKKSDKKKTTLTICHYCDYQTLETTKEPQKDHKETTKEPQKDTNNNVNNVNNENNENKLLNTSRRKQVYDHESIHYKLAFRLYEKILENNPDHKEPNLQQWANDVRLMMEQDKRTYDQIEYLIDWVQQDSFWKSNILSIKKLREKFDQLVIRVKEDISKQNKAAVKGNVPRAYQSLKDWADEIES